MQYLITLILPELLPYVKMFLENMEWGINVGGLLLLVVCFGLVIIQIILLVKSIKSKEKKYWISNFCLEFFSIVMAFGLLYYYDCLAPRGGFMPGLEYLGEELTCMGAGFLYSIMLYITVIARIIVFEKSQKSEGKKSANPFKLIIAFTLVVVGTISLIAEIKDNWGKVETTGTVIDFEEIRTGSGMEYWPIIQFSVDGQEYQDSYPMSDAEIGDTVKIYYSVYDNYNISRHLTNNKIIWIPTIIIGILMIFFRFKE